MLFCNNIERFVGFIQTNWWLFCCFIIFCYLAVLFYEKVNSLSKLCSNGSSEESLKTGWVMESWKWRGEKDENRKIRNDCFGWRTFCCNYLHIRSRYQKGQSSNRIIHNTERTLTVWSTVKVQSDYHIKLYNVSRLFLFNFFIRYFVIFLYIYVYYICIDYVDDDEGNVVDDDDELIFLK